MTTPTHYAIKIAKRFNLEPWLYSFIYRGFRNIHKKHGVNISTNNYGYYPTEIEAYDKYQLQMYDEYTKLLQEENIKQVLEIGSGAGGGLRHMQSRMPAVQFTGLDRCKEAIKTCKYFLDKQNNNIELYHDINELHYYKKRFDAIISVETGIYKNSNIFKDLYKLLNNNGIIVYYDNTAVTKLNGVKESVERHGFKIELFNDITENVYRACEHDNFRRMEITDKYLPKYLRPFNSELQRYMCVIDSPRYINFSNGKKKSFFLKARKTKLSQTPLINFNHKATTQNF
ncbi:Methyltransferase domain-containing protein [Nitrosomonas aestuarii]|uniref:Methyltransferase domain-containing protein n=1 Tax=Nitrosomonas aestuarii TaxID=52441 RepID=A0A1I4G2Y2_9PROT|nr:class I SAM-dependent methyltransferase [Nitrosomonas aestuarii]SFL24053.1 Methyltransferase domain-containing protein [Nitrosomonas aestuarii]